MMITREPSRHHFEDDWGRSNRFVSLPKEWPIWVTGTRNPHPSVLAIAVQGRAFGDQRLPNSSAPRRPDALTPLPIWFLGTNLSERSGRRLNAICTRLGTVIGRFPPEMASKLNGELTKPWPGMRQMDQGASTSCMDFLANQRGIEGVQPHGEHEMVWESLKWVWLCPVLNRRRCLH
jgi:hypothetical protein